MDNEMIDKCCLALEKRFKEFVSKTAGMSFEETKVGLPSKQIWIDYSLTIIKALREPSAKMAKETNLDMILDYQKMLDVIVGEVKK